MKHNKSTSAEKELIVQAENKACVELKIKLGKLSNEHQADQ